MADEGAPRHDANCHPTSTQMLRNERESRAIEESTADGELKRVAESASEAAERAAATEVELRREVAALREQMSALKHGDVSAPPQGDGADFQSEGATALADSAKNSDGPAGTRDEEFLEVAPFNGKPFEVKGAVGAGRAKKPKRSKKSSKKQR